MVAVTGLRRDLPLAAMVATAAGAVVAAGAAGAPFGRPLIVAALAIVTAALACLRFEAFVLALIVVRPSLDALTPVGGGGTGSIATWLGWLFVCTAVTWLLVQSVPVPVPSSRLLVAAWSALAGVAGASALVSSAPGPAFEEAARIAAVALVAAVVHRMVTDVAALGRLLAALLLAAVLPVAVALFQAATGDGRLVMDAVRVRGTFLHPNSLAVFLAFVLVTCCAALFHVAGPFRLSLAVLGLGAAAALLATLSRGAWIAALTGLAVVLALRAPRLLPALVALVVVGLLVSPSLGRRISHVGQERHLSGAPGDSLVWRVDYWRRAVPLAGRSPVLGLGPGAVERHMEEGKPPHSDPVRVAVELGVAGLAAYGALLCGLVRVARRCLRVATGPVASSVALASAGAVAAFLVLSLVANLMSQVAVMWGLAALLGGAAAVPRLLGDQSRMEDGPECAVGVAGP